MTIQRLIENWASRRVREVLHTEVRAFDAVDASKKIIFVACLVSGKSQLAFRKLCSIVEGVGDDRPPVLIVDSEDLLPDRLLPVDPRFYEANGLVYLYRNGHLDTVESGSDLPLLVAKLTAFLRQT